MEIDKFIGILKRNFLVILLLIYIFSLPFKNYIPRMPVFSFMSIAVFLKFLILGILLLEIILGRRRLVLYKQYFILFLFVLIVFFSTLWIKDIMLSLRGIWALFHLLGLGFLITQLINTKELLKWTFMALIFGGLIVSLVGVWQYLINSGERVTGLIGDPNGFASFLVFLVPLNFYLSKFYEDFKKIGLFLILILMNLVLFLTFSRGGVIALFIVWLLIFLKERKKFFLLALFLLIFLVCLPLIPTNFWLRTGTIFGLERDSVAFVNLRTGTIEQRAKILASGFKMFLDNPLSGVGIGNFKVRFHEYVSSPIDYRSLAKVSHNMFLEIAAELGIFGLIVFLYLIYNAFKILVYSKIKFLQNKELFYIIDGLKVSLIGVLVTSLFLSIEWSIQLWLLLFMIMSLKNLK